MRKWHRWLVVFTGVFLVWIAATGLVGQVVSLAGGEHHEGPLPGANAGRPKLPTAAADDGDRNGPPGEHGGSPDLYHVIIDLHSGAYFGPVGKGVSALLGAAMLFFSISGVWMYIDMFRKRRRNGRPGLFWK